MKIKKQLIVVSLIMYGLIILLTLITLGGNYMNAEKSFRSFFEIISAKTRSGVEDRFIRVEDGIYTLANVMEIYSRPEDIILVQRYVNSKEYIHGAALIHKDTGIIIKSVSPGQAKRFLIDTIDYSISPFLDIQESLDTYLWIHDDILHKDEMVVRYYISDKAALYVHIDVEKLLDDLLMCNGNEYRSFIIDRKGNLVKNDQKNNALSNYIIEENVLENRAEVYLMDSLLVSGHVLKNGWRLFVTADLKGFVDEFMTLSFLLVGSFLVVIAFNVLFSVRLAAGITGPLRAILRKMKIVLSTERERRELDGDKISKLEFAEISDHFKKMLRDINYLNLHLKDEVEQKHIVEKELKNLNQELENRVRWRTEELELTNFALNQSITHLRDTQSQLVQSEKMAALGGLVAGISHEINTPLGVSITSASLLQEDIRKLFSDFEKSTMTKNSFVDFTRTAEETVGILLRNLYRAADLVRNFKKVAVDQTSEARRSFELCAYIEDCIQTLSPQFKHSRHKIIVKYKKKIFIESYPGIIAQIVTNLLMNSIKHGFEELEAGTIVIYILCHYNTVTIRYSDDGCGITEEVKDKIFEPFFTTKMGQGGSGLGMNIVYNLVTSRLRGSIDVSGTEGQGVSFTIHFPRISK